MSNVIPLKKPEPTVPDYAVKLLFAAKNVMAAASDRDDRLIQELEVAIMEFEDLMPVRPDGYIRTGD